MLAIASIQGVRLTALRGRILKQNNDGNGKMRSYAVHSIYGL